MGTLQEVTVVRHSDKVPFSGHAWLREDGSFEAWWYENGIRHTYPFDLNGRQLGHFKRYTIQLRQT